MKGYQEGIAQVTANHHELPLGDIKCLGTFEDDDKTNGDESINHPQTEASDN
jgi:hypothetical protein